MRIIPMTKTKTLLALIAAVALTSVAQAEPRTFKDAAGNVWTITKSVKDADVSRLMISPDAAKSCPQRRVMLEASNLGPKMTKAQKFRGDVRTHIVCDRSSSPQQAAN